MAYRLPEGKSDTFSPFTLYVTGICKHIRIDHRTDGVLGVSTQQDAVRWRIEEVTLNLCDDSHARVNGSKHCLNSLRSNACWYEGPP